MNIALYTIIFEYREGTYVEQVQAHDEVGAFKSWALNIDPSNIQHFGKKSKQQLIEDSKNEDYAPVLLNSLTNAWCAGWSLSGLINIIKTANQI
jgi:hypothetical protein